MALYIFETIDYSVVGNEVKLYLKIINVNEKPLILHLNGIVKPVIDIEYRYRYKM